MERKAAIIESGSSLMDAVGGVVSYVVFDVSEDGYCEYAYLYLDSGSYVGTHANLPENVDLGEPLRIPFFYDGKPSIWCRYIYPKTPINVVDYLVRELKALESKSAPASEAWDRAREEAVIAGLLDMWTVRLVEEIKEEYEDQKCQQDFSEVSE